MYLISLLLDDTSNNKLNYYISRINKQIDEQYQIVPHLTITSFYSSKEEAFDVFKSIQNKGSFEIDLISFGFLPHACIVNIAFNSFLYNIYKDINILTNHLNKNIYYKDECYYPHITLSKHIYNKDKEVILKCLQDEFKPMKATIKAITLSTSNPYEELARIEL